MKTSNLSKKLIKGLFIALLGLLTTSAARAQIYEANINGSVDNGVINEYSLGGTPTTSLVSGLYEPQGLAVSGTDLFVSESDSAGDVGEYTTSGATVNASLITGLGYARGIVDSGSQLFVASSANNTIGEYTINPVTGMVVSSNASLVTGLSTPYGLAISGSDLFVVNQGNGTIGEYTTSGGIMNTSLITGNAPTAIAASGSDLFVVNSGNGTIGEYTTSGAVINASLVTGLPGGDYGIAVNGSELVVTQYGNAQLTAGSGSVYEYTLGATPGTVTSSNTSFITGLYEPSPIIAVPEPSSYALALLCMGLFAYLRSRHRPCQNLA